MQNKSFRFGPVALTSTFTTNLLNPPATTGGTNAGSSSQYVILKHLRVTNKTATPASVSLWLGATGANAAGTEVVWTATTVPPTGSALNYLDWYGTLRLDAADFLVGGASAGTTLTIEGEGEIGVAG